MSAARTYTLDEQRRYAVYGEIASGGMASIQYARLLGVSGFSRPVVFKKLHPHFAKDSSFVAMFLDEARVTSRIAHANVVATLDVLQSDSELGLVLEYVHGESLARLVDVAREQGIDVPPRIACSILAGVLHGLHAAHDTCGEQGEPLSIVHRDVSPENVLVGEDGVARILDFGIAKARGSRRATPAGEMKGKLAYMACEQFRGQPVDRRTDVYGAAVVLWETLVGGQLFGGGSDAALIHAVMEGEVLPPSRYVTEVSAALDAIVMRGLSRDPGLRFATAREMALALEREVGVATQSEVSDWLRDLAGDLLEARSAELKRMQAQGGSAPARAALGTRRIEGALPEVAPRAARPYSPSRRGLSATLIMAASALAGAGVWAVSLANVPAEGAALAHALELVPRPPVAQSAAIADVPALAAPPDEPKAAHAQRAAPPVRAEPRAEATLGGEHRRARPRTKRASAPVVAREFQEAPSAPLRDCSPPYVVDALGIRRLKRECL